MMKDEEPDIETLEIDREATTIPEVLEMFEDVLLGLGYRFDGRLEIVEEEENA